MTNYSSFKTKEQNKTKSNERFNSQQDSIESIEFNLILIFII
jgi:hypothetical protein